MILSSPKSLPVWTVVNVCRRDHEYTGTVATGESFETAVFYQGSVQYTWNLQTWICYVSKTFAGEFEPTVREGLSQWRSAPLDKKLIWSLSAPINFTLSTNAPTNDKPGILFVFQNTQSRVSLAAIHSSDFSVKHFLETNGFNLDNVKNYVRVDDATIRGYLQKLSHRWKVWNRRWFVFDWRAGTLIYYKWVHQLRPFFFSYFQRLFDWAKILPLGRNNKEHGAAQGKVKFSVRSWEMVVISSGAVLLVIGLNHAPLWDNECPKVFWRPRLKDKFVGEVFGFQWFHSAISWQYPQIPHQDQSRSFAWRPHRKHIY